MPDPGYSGPPVAAETETVHGLALPTVAEPVPEPEAVKYATATAAIANDSTTPSETKIRCLRDRSTPPPSPRSCPRPAHARGVTVLPSEYGPDYPLRASLPASRNRVHC